MPARTRRLFGPVNLTAANLTIATVPSGQTWIVKWVVCVNSGALAAQLELELNTGTPNIQLIRRQAVAADSWVNIETGLVFHEGEQILARQTGGTGSVLTLSGHGSRYIAV